MGWTRPLPASNITRRFPLLIAFAELFGPSGDPKAHFITAKTSRYDDPNPPTAEELALYQYYADIAVNLQKVTEEMDDHAGASRPALKRAWIGAT